ncbi:MAG: hypothetical protein ACFFG0_40330 [Candidatus Thorarchaeota archaeon]
MTIKIRIERDRTPLSAGYHFYLNGQICKMSKTIDDALRRLNAILKMADYENVEVQFK